MKPPLGSSSRTFPSLQNTQPRVGKPFSTLSSLQLLATTDLLSVSMDFLPLDISYKRNHTISDLFLAGR